MPDNGLKIRIGADLQGAIKQVNTLTSSITGLGKAVLQPINTNGLASAVTQLKVNIGNISAGKINQIPGVLNNVSVSANAASGRLQAMTQSLVNIGGGLNLIPANIQPIVNALASVSSQANITSSAVKALGSVLELSTVAVSIVAAAATVGYLAYTYFQASEAEKEAAAQAKKYAEQQDKLSLHLQDQVLNVQSLVRIATSDVSTKKEQAQALIALNDLIPDNIGKLTKQNITTEVGISIIRRYTQALEDQATAELLRGRAAELRVKKFDEEKAANDKILKITNDRAELLARLNRGNAQATPEEKQSNAFRTGSDIMTRQFDEFDRNIKSITEDLNISRHKLDEQLTALRDGIDSNTKGALPLTIKVPKVKVDKVDGLTEQIKQLTEFKRDFGLTQSEEGLLLSLQMKVTIRDQQKLGLNADQLQRKIEQLVIDDNLRLPLPLLLRDDVEAEVKRKLGSLPVFSLPLDVNVEDLGVTEAIKKIDVSRALLTQNPTTILVAVDDSEARKKLRKLAEDINGSLQKAVTGAFEGLGEAIGTALAGGDVQNIFSSFISVLSTGLKEIGKAMIAFGVAKEILNKIGKLNGFVAIAAGVALVAAGAALQTSVNKRKFAEGGIVSGPTSATIGEAGPEVVFPLTDLNSTMRKIMGGRAQDSGFVASTSISGDHLKVLIERAAKRSGGSFSF